MSNLALDNGFHFCDEIAYGSFKFGWKVRLRAPIQ